MNEEIEKYLKKNKVNDFLASYIISLFSEKRLLTLNSGDDAKTDNDMSATLKHQTPMKSESDTNNTAGSDCQERLIRHAFPNRAGDHEATDDVLTAELEKAGITIEKHEFLRRRNSEVKTAVIGSLHGWSFERAWYYWVAKGPGIELEAAEKLHAAHGRSVRVDGHCGCPSPGEWFEGLACGAYHVDDQEGLNALADTIRELVSRLSNPEA